MLKAGVLGAGHLGKIHLRLLNQSPKYNLVGFYDADESNAQKVSEELGY
ncbi:MAG: Gfo/Idh/MocA family oxidoreductase, partial [Bacteroidia bacterium]|nr:Gfo/Idh/MocA family oxidoreductase [Bacteroidia bacterium]